MNAINTQSLVPIIQSVVSFVGNEGLYPQSLTRDEIVFGVDASDLGEDEPIIRLDGIRRIERNGSPNALVAEIDGATFRESGKGGFLSNVVRLEDLLGAIPQTVFSGMRPSIFSMNDFRPGFNSRLESLAHSKFREIIVEAKGDAALRKNLYELALDIALAAHIEEERLANIKVDVLFLSAMLLAASKQDGADDKAVQAFQRIMRTLLQEDLNILAAVVGELIRYSIPDSSPRDVFSIDEILMESWHGAAEDLSQIDATFLVPMFRGLKLALHIKHWEGAMRFYEFNSRTNEAPATASINHLRTAWAALKSVEAKGNEGGKLVKALRAIDRAQTLKQDFARNDKFRQMRRSLYAMIEESGDATYPTPLLWHK